MVDYRDVHLDETTYRRIVSGENRSIAAGLLRILLWLGALLYGCVMRCRNWCYDTGLLGSISVDVPVICIGNITTGGTGKTPLVIWLCRYLQGKGLRCAILTRGYKTEGEIISDEPALLAEACGETPVVINSDRVAGARKAIETHRPDVLIMDDGFQHRRLRRDMDILAIDATCPFGYGHILPAGLLREPLGSLRRASAMIITRSNQVSDEQIRGIEQTIKHIAPEPIIAKSIHQQTHAITPDKQIMDMKTLRSKTVYAFCGIGNPQAFFDSLTQSGLKVLDTQVFDDHHAYTKSDIQSILGQAQACGAALILCTQKDWGKCETLLPDGNEPVFASMAMELDFIEGFDTIRQQLETLLQSQGIQG